MAENSKIQWTHHTFNPWRGCTKVSPGCANCYAERDSKRFPDIRGIWGAYGTRVLASEASWREPLRWNRDAELAGERKRVFCASLADVFEQWDGNPQTHRGEDVLRDGSPATLDDLRERLFKVILETPYLDWLLLTKRPEHVVPRWSSDLRKCANIWIGTSVENKEHGIPRIEVLRQIPAAIHFLSIEPLLEDLGTIDLKGIDWVIVGGESGPRSRAYDPNWHRSIIDQCRQAGVAVFVKQWGSNPVDIVGRRIPLADHKGGDMNEWPIDDRIREIPC